MKATSARAVSLLSHSTLKDNVNEKIISQSHILYHHYHVNNTSPYGLSPDPRTRKVFSISVQLAFTYHQSNKPLSSHNAKHQQRARIIAGLPPSGQVHLYHADKVLHSVRLSCVHTIYSKSECHRGRFIALLCVCN